MKHSRFKNFSKRKNLKKDELSFIILKSLLYNEKIKKNLRLNLHFYFFKKNFKTQIESKCIESYTSSSVFKIFNLNRSILKTKINYGNITGFKKSSW